MKLPLWSLCLMASAMAVDALAQEVTVRPKQLKTLAIWNAPSSDSNPIKYNPQGTTVTLELAPNQGVILSIKDIKLQIGGTEAILHYYSSNSRPMEPCEIAVHTDAIGLADADQKVKVEGKVSVLVASKTSSIISGMVTWAPNTKIAFNPSAGMPVITLDSVQPLKSSSGVSINGTTLELEIEGKWQTDILSEFKVLPMNGLPILMKKSSPLHLRHKNSNKDWLTLQSESPLQDGYLQITFWTDAKWIEVPVSLTLGGNSAP